MAECVILNDFLTVSVSTRGAELQSIKSVGGTEFIWQGDEQFWKGKCPLVFPICGALIDDTFTHDGKAYQLQKHGYIRFREFVVEKQDACSVTFLDTSDDETYASYPFRYELRVTYVLKEETLRVFYSVKNIDEKTMYFSIGAHEGYACPGGIEAYSLVFEKTESLRANEPVGDFLKPETISITENSREFPLKDKYKNFKDDALVFKQFNSSSVKLCGEGREVIVNFPEFPYLVIWNKPGAPYICIEPWCGIQDGVEEGRDITKKEGINALACGESFERLHEITCKG